MVAEMKGLHCPLLPGWYNGRPLVVRGLKGNDMEMKRRTRILSFSRVLTSALFAACTLVVALGLCVALSPASLAAAAPKGTGNTTGLSTNLSLGKDNSTKPAAGTPEDSFRGIIATIETPQKSTHRIVAQDTNGTIRLLLPSCANLAKLAISLPEPYTTPVYVSASASGPFTTGAFDVRTCTRDAQGSYLIYVRYTTKMKPFAVAVSKSSNVDAMFLSSADPVKYGRAYIEASPDHSTQTTGSYALVSKSGELSYSGDLSRIRGRGLSSWEIPKRSYQIKLDKKASLIDDTPENKTKTWLLIANGFDKTMLRNYLTYKTALAIGMTHTSDCKFVDLYYDDEYRGLYMLCEKISLSEGSVNADEIENTSDDGTPLDDKATALGRNAYGYTYQYVRGAVSPALPQQTGYLMELDFPTYSTERCWFFTSAGPVVVKSPDNLSQKQVAFISESMQRAINEASKADGNMQAHWDMTSFARNFLVNELTKNSDWLRYSSTYFYFDNADGLIHSGPVWDFDLAYGIHKYEGFGEYIDPAGWASLTSTFFIDNAQFKSAMRNCLETELLPAAHALTGNGSYAGVISVRQAARSIAGAAAMNDLLWEAAQASVVIPNPTTFNEGVSYLQRWLTERVAWLENHAADYPIAGPSGTGFHRLAGYGALSTMSAIVDYGNFAKGGTVVLATANGYWDAMTASSMAGFAKAPVLMTNGEELSNQTALQLRKLRPTKVIVCGGTAAISNKVMNQARNAAAGQAAGKGQVSSAGAQVKAYRCAGYGAASTAVDIFAKAPGITGGTWARTAFVCTNASYHDALSAAPVSYATGMPIFLSNGASSFSQGTIDALRKGDFLAVYVVGGRQAISDEAVQQLRNAGIRVAGRIAGYSAIGTSQEVAKFGLAKGMSANNMGVATSLGYWDALSGASLCGSYNSVIVLAQNHSSASISNFIASHKADISRIFVFGGQAALDGRTGDAIKRAAGV